MTKTRKEEDGSWWWGGESVFEETLANAIQVTLAVNTAQTWPIPIHYET